MSPEEVSGNEVGDSSLVAHPLPCDERHYKRFLRKVIPGPERTLGAYCCDVCKTYFDEEGNKIS